MQGSLSALRAQAEIYFGNTNNSYAALFTSNNTWASADAQVQNLLTAVINQVGSTACTVAGTASCRAGSSASAWAAQAELPSTVGGSTHSYFCVDSTGAAKTSATQIVAGATNC
jgi:hypothetical protein